MLGEVQIGREAREYVRHVAETAGVDGVDVFCCDKTKGRGEMFDLFGYGIGHELKDAYRRLRLFEVDPFADIAIRETRANQTDSFELGCDPRVSANGERAEKYWRFMAEKQIDIVGAATRRFLPGFYLVVGLHRVKGRGLRPEVSYPRLGEQLRTVKDMISVSILNRVLQASDGYGLLRRTVGFQQPAGPDRGPVLSPRESEISQLICAGKQNKEIAYLTGLSVHTIENHLKRIYRKFHIHNRAALVAKLQS